MSFGGLPSLLVAAGDSAGGSSARRLETGQRHRKPQSRAHSSSWATVFCRSVDPGCPETKTRSASFAPFGDSTSDSAAFASGVPFS